MLESGFDGLIGLPTMMNAQGLQPPGEKGDQELSDGTITQTEELHPGLIKTWSLDQDHNSPNDGGVVVGVALLAGSFIGGRRRAQNDGH